MIIHMLLCVLDLKAVVLVRGSSIFFFFLSPSTDHSSSIGLLCHQKMAFHREEMSLITFRLLD